MVCARIEVDMRAADQLSAFAGHKYLNLETFRKNGVSVRTPVWFAADPSDAGKLYVYTIGNTGKVKRIRNNSRVQVAPCEMRGGLLSDWVEARAQILTGEEASHGMELLNRKYIPWKQVLDFFAMYRRRERVVMAIRVM